MKKFFITACLFAILGSVAHAQDEEPEKKLPDGIWEIFIDGAVYAIHETRLASLSTHQAEKAK